MSDGPVVMVLVPVYGDRAILRYRHVPYDEVFPPSEIADDDQEVEDA